MSFLALSSDDASMPNEEQLRLLLESMAERLYGEDQMFIATEKFRKVMTDADNSMVERGGFIVDWSLVAESDKARYRNIAAAALTYMRERVRGEMQRGNLDVRVERK